MLPQAAQRIISILVSILTAAFSVFCIRSLITFTGSNQGVTAVSMTWIKMNWLYYAFMFSFGCMLVVSIIKAGAPWLGKTRPWILTQRQKKRPCQEEKEVDLGI